MPQEIMVGLYCVNFGDFMKKIYQDEFFDNLKWQSDLDFVYSNVEILNVNLLEKDFPMISFEGATLTNCTFSGDGVMFDRILDCDIVNSRFISVNFNKTTILGTHFNKCLFEKINSHGMEVSNSIFFNECYFDNFKIMHSYVTGVFRNCQFNDSIFSDLVMRNGNGSFEIKSNSDGNLFLA